MKGTSHQELNRKSLSNYLLIVIFKCNRCKGYLLDKLTLSNALCILGAFYDGVVLDLMNAPCF